MRPILKAHCFHCHGEAGVREGELDVRLRRWMIEGGDSGPAIVPGDLDGSVLWQRVSAEEMPPGDKKLSGEELNILRHWIDSGAATSRPEPDTLDNGDYITEEERDFWAFQPIGRPAIPDLQHPSIETPIDAFVLERLQQNGLQFSSRVDRRTLIRRATFDLWGLPPEPDMVDDFVRDEHPAAYARLIDRLLASPRYGERWGRHWLDVAGYADSDGYNEDHEREFAYFYRDYVINSFNAGKSLDQFVLEQLAGDEMVDDATSGPPEAGSDLTPSTIERLAATGFLRTAPDGTAEGGVNRQEAANETIADTIEIVTTSLLGLTVGCARCHDHRYDPISQADYYRFRAIFEPALDYRQWRIPSQRQLSLYTAQDRQMRQAVEDRAKAAEAEMLAKQQAHIERTLEEELLVAPDDRREALRLAFTTVATERTPEQVALLKEHPNIGNISSGSLYLYAEQRARRAGAIEKLAAEREANYLRQAQHEHLATIQVEARGLLAAIIDTPEESRTDEQKKLVAEYPQVFVSTASLEQSHLEWFNEVRRYREAANICRATDAKTELANMRADIAAIRATAPVERFVRVLNEPNNHLPVTNLFIRGNYNQPAQELLPDELTVLKADLNSPVPADNPALPTSGRRLAYAKWLTSGSHPLLARVLVNRIWMHHFGRGIVDSPGDFGLLGARPSHPALLDWLATDLMAHDWDLKRLHRLIMASHVYQQVSTRDDTTEMVDPDNIWLSRMNPRRLESESIRDAMLAVSQTLANDMLGPAIPVKEDAVGRIVIGKENLDGERKPTGEEKEFIGTVRRSVYIQVRRTRPLAVLEAFDLPSVAPNCIARGNSNAATQSLMMMNSDFVIAASEKLADLLIQQSDDLPVQLSLAWERCFAAKIETDMLDQLVLFAQQQSELFRKENEALTPQQASRLALAQACQAMLGSNAFIHID